MAEQFERAVGDDLIGVHVGGSAGAALNHVDDELVVKLAGADFAASAHDCIELVFAQQAQFVIGKSRCFLDEGQASDEMRIAADRCSRHLEILHGSCRVHPPINLGGNILLAQQVILASRLDHIILLWWKSS